MNELESILVEDIFNYSAECSEKGFYSIKQLIEFVRDSWIYNRLVICIKNSSEAINLIDKQTNHFINNSKQPNGAEKFDLPTFILLLSLFDTDAKAGYNVANKLSECQELPKSKFLSDSYLLYDSLKEYD